MSYLRKRWDENIPPAMSMLAPVIVCLSMGCASLPVTMDAARKGVDLAEAGILAAQLERQRLSEACEVSPQTCDAQRLGDLAEYLESAKVALGQLREALAKLADALPPQ